MGTVFLVYALFVEKNVSCYSDGVNWSAAPDSAGLYKDVAHAFSVVYWGLAITNFVNFVLSLTFVANLLWKITSRPRLALIIVLVAKIVNALVSLGFGITAFVVRLSDSGELCSENILTKRGWLLSFLIWSCVVIFGLGLLIFLCVVCLKLIQSRRR